MVDIGGGRKIISICFTDLRKPIFPVVLLLASTWLLSSCHAASESTQQPVESEVTKEQVIYLHTTEKLGVMLDDAWQMHQDNSLTIDVFNLSQPLILAIELIPRLAREPVMQKPAVLDGTPVAGQLEEVKGFLTLHQVTPQMNQAHILFPAQLFDPALYASGGELQGWELRVMLTSEVVAYPVADAKSVGKRYTITPDEIQAQQTWLKSEAASEMILGKETDSYLTIPNSRSGMFLYYPVNRIIDSIVLTSDLPFNFKVTARR